MLQGVYAFLGITEFWRQQRTAGSPVPRHVADFEFALARRQTWTGLRQLGRSDQLTDWGRRFVAGMARRLRPWLSERVPASADREAWALFLDHRAQWRNHNVQVEPGWIRAALARWRDGADAPPPVTAEDTVRPDGPAWTHQRPHWYRAVSATSDQRAWPTSSDGDVLLRRGHSHQAELYFQRAVATSSSDSEAWAGLGLAVAAQPGRDEWRVLLHRPELVKALYEALGDERPHPSPVSVAQWLAR